MSRASAQASACPFLIPFLTLLIGLFLTGTVSSVQAAYVKRYTTIANGAMTYTGNTLGLSKYSSQNRPGTSGSIGTFITTDLLLQENSLWYPGTTGDWTRNAAAAQLRLPAGSTVLYAELIWGGSYNYGGQNVGSFLNNAVILDAPSGTFSVSPSPLTAFTTPSGENYYVRSADVTSRVSAGGAGTYRVSRVPGTEGSSENNANAAGWTLAVIYENAALPARNMTIFVGAELTSSQQTTTSSVSGFCTPQSGPIAARMMVAAIEGDSNLTGDQMQFGPTVGTLSPVSGPNNPLNNFFASQINRDDGTLDTAGTFGTRNHSPGSNSTGRRQGWDVTNVDVSANMQNSQSSAFARGTTSGDRYTIASIGLQIDVGQPVFPTAVMVVDKPVTYVGDILTYTTRLDNTAGSANALNTVFTNTPPPGLSFIPGTVTLNGVLKPGADPVAGIAVGTVAAGVTVVVSYQMQVNAVPLPPAIAEYRNNARWDYQYESCPGFPLNNGTITTNPDVVTLTPRILPSKSANPPGSVPLGNQVTYTITVPNTGTGISNGTTLVDPIPVGTTYVAGTTTLNGNPLADAGGQMPFATVRLINSPSGAPGQIVVGEAATVSFRVTITDPPLDGIITNTATVDPDGAGPAPAIDVSITNPPVEADLAVVVDDAKTEVTAGTPNSYTVTVSNNGPDAVSRFNLDVSFPASFTGVVYTPGAGTYTVSTGEWTGLNLAAGQTVQLILDGTVSPSATDSITIEVQVTPAPGIVDPDYGNNTDDDTDAVIRAADLAITKTDGRDTVAPGSVVTYTMTVTNNGPSRVRSLTVVDTLPPLLQGPVFTPSQGVYNETTGLWTGLNLQPGQNVTLLLTGTVDLSATGDFINSVTLSPPDGVTDPEGNNNNDDDTDTVALEADLAVTKTDGQENVFPGSPITYLITVTNNGPNTVEGITVVDSLPPELLSPVFTPAQGTYDPGTGLWTGLNLSAGQSVTLELAAIIDPSASGDLVNTVTVSPPAGVVDPDPGNNSDTDGNLLAKPSVQLTKTVEPQSANPGEELLYTVHFWNRGGGEARNLILVDSVPLYTTYLSGSLQRGDAGSSYDDPANQRPTDAADSDDGQSDGTSVIFIIDSLDPDDGNPGVGSDEGNVYFKVTVQ